MIKLKISLVLNYFLIIFVSIITSLYFFEVYLNITNKQSDYKKIIQQYYNETGKNYDERTKIEVFNDLKKIENDIFVSMYPMAHLTAENQSIFPLSGVSNVKSIHCNENGYYSKYKSDRYGFNNPDTEWNKDTIDYMLVGDSYTHGACVNRPDDIASGLRKISNKSVLNLGFTGNGPLLEYATLKEYLNKDIKKVIWIYYAGNDLQDLTRELKNPILSRYLNPNFSQNLLLKQNEVNMINKKILSKIIVDTKFNNLKKNSKFKYKILKFLQLDKTKDKIKVLMLKKDHKLDNLEKFKIILQNTNNLVLNNKSKLYFVYIPDFEIYRNKLYPKHHENIIESIVKKMNIPFINIHRELFSKKNDPLKYYPFKIRHHFTPEGYFEIAKTIFKKVNK